MSDSPCQRVGQSSRSLINNLVARILGMQRRFGAARKCLESGGLFHLYIVQYISSKQTNNLCLHWFKDEVNSVEKCSLMLFYILKYRKFLLVFQFDVRWGFFFFLK